MRLLYRKMKIYTESLYHKVGDLPLLHKKFIKNVYKVCKGVV